MTERLQEDVSHLPHERIVAFIDILGFRSLVGRMSTEPAIYKLIRDALGGLAEDARRLRREEREMASLNVDIAYTPAIGLRQAHFSDTVVFSQSIDPGTSERAAGIVVHYAAVLAGRLLRAGILVRGGIARGWAFHEGNVLFGKGVVAAYDLESRVSRVPRIVVADDVAGLLDSVEKRQRLQRDSDGFWFIDVLAELWSGDEITMPDAEEFRRLGVRLKDWLHSARQDFDLLAKYRWLALQFNRTIDDNRESPGFESVERVPMV